MNGVISHLLAFVIPLVLATATFDTFASPPPADVHTLQIGDAAPDFALPGIDGKTHRLSDYQNANILMIAFISNHCPDSHAAVGRIKKFAAALQGQSFALVAINPNNPAALDLSELGYSKYNDGFDDMKKYAAEESFHFPFLYDGERQTTAMAYGCLATPHIFIFDAQRKLRYKGQFDDSRFADLSTVKSHDAENAVEALLAGKPVPVAETQPHGCTTKWMENSKPRVSAVGGKPTPTPVDVETIDNAGVLALRRNATSKLRLFNVWAMWCGPCREEFPELVKTSIRFSLRSDFEFITLSTDDPKDVDKVKSFLEKQGAGVPKAIKSSLRAESRKTNSYLYTGADVNGLLKTLDPEWPGGVPYSVLVAPGGKILWRHAGEVDADELRGKILEALGTCYVPEK